MAKKKKSKGKQAGDPWQIAKKKYGLAVRHVKMAKALGLNPKKFGGYANHQQQSWKAPLRNYIEELYEEKFGPYVEEGSENSPNANAHEGSITPDFCEDDGFPMITINGKPECIAEYTDRCIGGKTVTDVIKENSTVYLHFEDGHLFPLLCNCCGEPYLYQELHTLSESIVGLHLHELAHDTVELDDGQEVPSLILFFDPPNHIGNRQQEFELWYESPKSIKHASTCKQRRKRTPSLR